MRKIEVKLLALTTTIGSSSAFTVGVGRAPNSNGVNNNHNSIRSNHDTDMNTNTIGNSRINLTHERIINGSPSSSIIRNNSNRNRVSSSSLSTSTALFNTQKGTQKKK
eukprot:680657_1